MRTAPSSGSSANCPSSRGPRRPVLPDAPSHGGPAPPLLCACTSHLRLPQPRLLPRASPLAASPGPPPNGASRGRCRTPGGRMAVPAPQCPSHPWCPLPPSAPPPPAPPGGELASRDPTALLLWDVSRAEGEGGVRRGRRRAAVYRGTPSPGVCSVCRQSGSGSWAAAWAQHGPLPPAPQLRQPPPGRSGRAVSAGLREGQR